MSQVFLDCDGVLADFDQAAEQLFHRKSRDAEAALGTKAFWSRINACGNFYRNLPLLPDAMRLYESIAHLNPIILTGCPAGGWAEPQKVAWAAHHFPGVPIITCRSRDKCFFLRSPGDILVDDYLKYQSLWEGAGGIFIHHRTADESIQHLAKLGLPIRQLV